ncbi:MAG: redox-regulated ATPase YchF [Firmicutes bacterium]|jgi:GTP-binding protein YchF|nr:redox-regulated ATPase YchF [Bacillota bacterium]
MPISCGLVGLPNAGKSTLFNCLTSAGAATAPYAFTTVEPNTGTAAVPDDRLGRLARIVRPKTVVPAFLEVVDIAGLVRGASKGEGLGNRFLGHIREVDAVIHVVRCHADPGVPHPEPVVSPSRDCEIVNLELMLADLETVQRRRERIGKAARYGERREAQEDSALSRVEDALKRGIPARRAGLGAEERALVAGVFLITMKPVVYVGNVAEGTGDAAVNELYAELVETARRDGSPVVPVSARLEAEIAELAEADRSAFLEELGLEEPGSRKVIRAAYEALDYITFYTFNEKEARAWPIRRGTRAPRAAGRIHTDMEKGFARAEVVRLADLEEAGSFPAARDRGLVRSEGKDYEVEDGDVILFRFA